MCLYWEIEAGTGQGGYLLKETVLEYVCQVQLLERLLSY